jgi:hypothetical protein
METELKKEVVLNDELFKNIKTEMTARILINRLTFHREARCIIGHLLNLKNVGKAMMNVLKSAIK